MLALNSKSLSYLFENLNGQLLLVLILVLNVIYTMVLNVIYSIDFISR